MSTNSEPGLPAKTVVNSGRHDSNDPPVGKEGARPLALFIPAVTGAASMFDKEIG